MQNLSTTFENGVFRISLPRRISREDAPSIAACIFDAFPKAVERIEVDAGQLVYISSDGLDILIELKKRCRDIALLHVSAGLYEVLTSYGFTNFLSVEKKYRAVSIKNLPLLGAGSHGKVYKLNEDMIIKVFIDKSPLEAIERERAFAKNAFMGGIPSPIAFDVVETEEGYGLILELAGAQGLGEYLREHPEETQELGEKFADLLIKLNATYADPRLYPNIKEVWRKRAGNAVGRFTAREIGKVLKVIDSLPDGNTMVHGDYHPQNVMLDKNKNLMLIDMADICSGNGFFDIGGAYLSMYFYGSIAPTRAMQVTGMPYGQCKQLWEQLLKKYFRIQTEGDYRYYMKLCAAFSDLRMCVTMGMQSSNNNSTVRALAAIVCKCKLLHYKKWITLFERL